MAPRLPVHVDEGEAIVLADVNRRMWEVAIRSENGATCPCCEGRVNLDKKVMSASDLGKLLVLYREFGLKPFDIGDWDRQLVDQGSWTALNRTWTTLAKHLSVVLPVHHTKSTWRITQYGEKWILGKTQVPAAAWIFNDKPHFWSRECWTFAQAMKFRYVFNIEDVLSESFTPPKKGRRYKFHVKLPDDTWDTDWIVTP